MTTAISREVVVEVVNATLIELWGVAAEDIDDTVTLVDLGLIDESDLLRLLSGIEIGFDDRCISLSLDLYDLPEAERSFLADVYDVVEWKLAATTP